MKASSATSAKAGTEQPQPIGRSSARPASSPTKSSSFGLSGPSQRPDPATAAYRRDLADAALAGIVIASHYAEPLARRVTASTVLRAEPSPEAGELAKLDSGEMFQLLDSRGGWAWGYAGAERRVGYVPADVLGPA